MVHHVSKIFDEYGCKNTSKQSSEYAEDTTAEDEEETSNKWTNFLTIRTDVTGFPSNKYWVKIKN